jgi:hypothetical protein
MADQPAIPTGHFNQLHEAVTAALKGLLTGVSVEEHSGPFDLDELKAYGAKAPAVRVSLTGPSPTAARSTGNREATLVVAAYIITKAAPNRPAFKDANDIAERIAANVHNKTFGCAFCEPPKDVVIDNLYSGKVREFAGSLALQSVSWTQLVQFGVETAPVPVAGVLLPETFVFTPEFILNEAPQ